MKKRKRFKGETKAIQNENDSKGKTKAIQRQNESDSKAKRKRFKGETKQNEESFCINASS